MADSDEKDLAIEIMHTTDRALGNVRRKGKWIGGDPRGMWADSRERMEVVASNDTW